jgi:predicted nuclease of predicted toxin-antitoxin system
MKLLLDQGLARFAAERLRRAGHDATHVAELDMARADDLAIMARAKAEGAVVVTRDIDFHTELALSGAVGPSVIRVNIEGLKAEEQAMLIIRLVTRYEMDLTNGVAISVDRRQVRVRELPLS